MTARRSKDFALARAVLDPSFFPRGSDAQGLVALLADEGAIADASERALLRVAEPATLAILALETESDAHRARATRLLGRLAVASADERARSALLERLESDGSRTRRAAANALGKLNDRGLGGALGEALARETDPSVRRALVEALGKSGGDEALARLRVEGAGDDAAEEIRARAALMAERAKIREAPSTIDLEHTPEGALRVVLRCRAGLEELLASSLPASLGAHALGGALGPRVEGALVEAPSTLFQARTFLTFGFGLPRVVLERDDADALAEAVVSSLTSASARATLKAFTRGAIRYRLAWSGGGKRRATVWKVAVLARERAPELVNDPTDSPWEARVNELVDERGRAAIEIELVPMIDDPRFIYRLGDVPAASHPTIAAALVEVAGARSDDVAWDPFVGSGTELCERALFGPYARLYGSDADPAALEIAQRNLEAAGAEAALFVGDARSARPPVPVTLVISNPPLGRRLQRSADLGALLERVVANVEGALLPGGRLVWISPLPHRTAAAAEAAGLEATYSVDVDLGGFTATMQRFDKPVSRDATRSAESAAREPKTPRIDER